MISILTYIINNDNTINSSGSIENTVCSSILQSEPSIFISNKAHAVERNDTNSSVRDIEDKKSPVNGSLSIFGKIIDNENQIPVQGATVSFVQSGIRHDVNTDNFGRFFVTGLNRGLIYVYIIQSEYYDIGSIFSLILKEDKEIDIKAYKSIESRIFVLGEDNLAIENQRIKISSENRVYSVRTDFNGKAAIKLLPESLNILSIEREGYFEIRRVIEPTEKNIVIKLINKSGNSHIDGIIQCDNCAFDSPFVILMSKESSRPFFMAFQAIGGNRFVISGIHEGNYDLIFYSEGYELRHIGGIKAASVYDESCSKVLIKTKKNTFCSLNGVVQDDEGCPLSAVDIYISPVIGTNLGQEELHILGKTTESCIGKFTARIANGNCIISFYRRDLRREKKSIRLESDEFKMEPMNMTRMNNDIPVILSLKIIDAQTYEPVTEARIETRFLGQRNVEDINNEKTTEILGIPCKSGEIFIRLNPPGLHQITISKDGYKMKSLDIEIPAENIEVRLEKSHQ